MRRCIAALSLRGFNLNFPVTIKLFGDQNTLSHSFVFSICDDGYSYTCFDANSVLCFAGESLDVLSLLEQFDSFLSSLNLPRALKVLSYPSLNEIFVKTKEKEVNL